MVSKKITDKLRIKMQNSSSTKTLATTNLSINPLKKKKEKIICKIHTIKQVPQL